MKDKHEIKDWMKDAICVRCATRHATHLEAARNGSKDAVCDDCRATIYSEMLAAGVVMHYHESDLYVPINDTTKTIVDNYAFKANVTIFISQTDGKPWYDIPFAYQPFWDAKQKEAKRREEASNA